ncbi:glycosyltransferase family 1 protein [Streptomyces iconiensis]|uniref:D-inositol 3-phosphate glycosyltransferase n=1 Tax=Streptomyces iconiensis TaxID=1384038 RepID=A0ABT7A5W2_9ACTN|nr:glycosyltransferase [Streptomyces iconiensis]MDJ1136733.1 glycosyltransferase [Streptomyces iconiensis]
MSRTASPYQPPVGRAPLHAVQVLGGASSAFGGAPSAVTAAHVRSLAEGLVARGVRVTVCAAQESGLDQEFTGIGARFAATRGHTEPEAVASLRAVCADADLVHAHGLRAGLAAALALGRLRREVPLVVTWHTLPLPGTGEPGRAHGARGLVTRLLKRRVARAATVVLGVTADLVDAARDCGARDARLAPVALPGPRRTAPAASAPAHPGRPPHPDQLPDPEQLPNRDQPSNPDRPPHAQASHGRDGDPGAGGEGRARTRGPAAPGVPGPSGPSSAGGAGVTDATGVTGSTDARGSTDGTGAAHGHADAGRAEALRHKIRADLGAVGRPLLVAVGRLDRRHGYDTVLTASRAWRGLEPPPLLVIAGEGPERAALQARIEAEALPVRLLGRREDALRLLAGADLAVVSASWEGRSLLAQEALRAGVPLVATEVGGIPELVGEAAVLIPYGDPDSLASAVLALLADPVRRDAFADAGRTRAETWPTEDDTVAQVLSVYDELTRPAPG